MESAATDKLGEDSDVILEVGFDGKGLDLLELSERSAMGLERQRRRGYYCVGFWRRRRNGLIWRALVAAISDGCVVLCLCDSEVVQGKTCQVHMVITSM